MVRLTAVATGLSVVLTAALTLDARDPEPSGSIVLLGLGAAAALAIFLGRVIYHGVADLLSDTAHSQA